MSKYHPLKDGEWFEPYRKDNRHACCDCGLVHTFDLRVTTKEGKPPKVEIRFSRHERATAAMRRPLKFEKDDG